MDIRGITSNFSTRPVAPTPPLRPPAAPPTDLQPSPQESFQRQSPLPSPTAPAVPEQLQPAPAVAAPAVAAPVVPPTTSTLTVLDEPLTSDLTPLRPAWLPPLPQKDARFLERYGPWGVVTGASQGIGAEYARALAEKGMNVVLVARNGDKLKELAQQLKQEFQIEARVVSADLGGSEGAQKVIDATRDLQVGMLVNNAGSWQFGFFLENDLKKDVQSVAVNVEAPLLLTHHFAGKMAEQGKGGVMNIGSGAALHGVPGQAAYSGTKGFLQNLSEALYKELKPKGVDVLITNPGPVQGEASSVYDQSKVPMQKVSAREVATQSLGQLGKGSSTIPGWFNRLAMNVAVRSLPRDMLASIAGYILEKASDAGQHSRTPATGPARDLKPLSTPATRATAANEFLREYGPWGLVTGASQGIGAEYAEQLAAKGMNVVLVARSQDKLEGLARQLREKHGVEVKVVAADLSQPADLEKVSRETSQLDVGLLVNNAGSWQFGSFLDNDVQKDRQSVALNVTAPMIFSHEFGNRFAARGGGGIINVGSGAALHGVPGQATYSATKGFLRNLTESLHQELKPQGVKVLITNPGPVVGEASSAYDQSKVPLQKVTAGAVVEDSLKNLGKRSGTIPGWFNRLAMGVACRALSRDTLAGIAGYLLEKAGPQA